MPFYKSHLIDLIICDQNSYEPILPTTAKFLTQEPTKMGLTWLGTKYLSSWGSFIHI